MNVLSCISPIVRVTSSKPTLKAGKALTVQVDLQYRYVYSGPQRVTDTNMVLKGLGGLLIRKIEGDYNNVVGFPAASFFTFLDLLVDEDPDFLDI